MSEHFPASVVYFKRNLPSLNFIFKNHKKVHVKASFHLVFHLHRFIMRVNWFQNMLSYAKETAYLLKVQKQVIVFITH